MNRTSYCIAGLFLLSLFFLSCLQATAEPPARVVLFGDSTMITTYLRKEHEHQGVTAQLHAALEKAYPGQAVEIANLARNGEWIARYLIGGAYESDIKKLEGADLIFVRFGINDHKRVTETEYKKQLELFCSRLKEDFPKACLILETSIYADPRHFKSDRNLILNPYWDVVRAVAKEQGLALCDIYEAAKLETDKGNWDLRIRLAPKGTPFVLDASQDAGRENDKMWFSNIHPNAEGVRVSVNREVETLKALYPDRLPTGGGRLERPALTAADYESALDFPVGRLSQIRKIKRAKAPVAPPAKSLK